MAGGAEYALKLKYPSVVSTVCFLIKFVELLGSQSNNVFGIFFLHETTTRSTIVLRGQQTKFKDQNSKFKIPLVVFRYVEWRRWNGE